MPRYTYNQAAESSDNIATIHIFSILDITMKISKHAPKTRVDKARSIVQNGDLYRSPTPISTQESTLQDLLKRGSCRKFHLEAGPYQCSGIGKRSAPISFFAFSLLAFQTSFIKRHRCIREWRIKAFLSFCCCGEWALAHEHHVRNDSESPDVLLLPLIPLTPQNLWPCIIESNVWRNSAPQKL